MATDESPQTPDDVKSIVEDRDIRFVRLWFTDILGQLKSFSVNKSELPDAFEGGMGSVSYTHLTLPTTPYV